MDHITDWILLYTCTIWTILVYVFPGALSSSNMTTIRIFLQYYLTIILCSLQNILEDICHDYYMQSGICHRVEYSKNIYDGTE